MITAPTNSVAIEPVHWGAKLRRNPDTFYTEVAGQAVLCRTSARSLHIANEVVVGLWVLLDGRPLQEVTEPVSSGWSDTDRRRVIEVLRRLKAVGLIEDVDPDADPVDLPELDQVASPPTRLVVRATVREIDGAAVLEMTSGEGAGGLGEVELERSSGGMSALITADGDTIDRLTVIREAAETAVPDPLTAIDAMSVWVDSLVDPDLAEPGVLDGLAELTELFDMHPISA